MRRIFYLTVLFFSYTEAFLYRKCLAPSNPAFNTLYIPLTNSSTNPKAKTAIECSAYALAALSGKIKSLRASAFIFDSTNQTCQLGKTNVIYNDQLDTMVAIVDGSLGVNVLTGVKPLASVALSGLYAYFIFSELRLTNIYGQGFQVTYDGLAAASASKFVLMSPVQTLEGQYAWNPTPANIQVLAPTRSFTGFTFCAWYNSGASLGSTDPILNWWTNNINYLQAVLFVGYSVPGAVEFLIQNVINGGSYQNVKTASIVPVNTWAYLGATYDGTTGQVNVYMNGSLYASQTVAINGINSGIFSEMVGIDISIYGSYTVKGHIASLEMYDYPLNAAEMVTAMLESTSTRVTAN